MSEICIVGGVVLESTTSVPYCYYYYNSFERLEIGGYEWVAVVEEYSPEDAWERRTAPFDAVRVLGSPSLRRERGLVGSPRVNHGVAEFGSCASRDCTLRNRPSSLHHPNASEHFDGWDEEE